MQLAVAAGAEVTAVCSLTKRDHVTALGAQHVLDYARDDWADGSERYDVIRDIAGMGRQLRGTMLSPFIGATLKILLARERGADYEQLTELLDAGRLRPVLDRTYPLEQAAEAMRKLEEGAIRVKAAITM